MGLQEGLKAKFKESDRRQRYVEPETPEAILAVIYHALVPAAFWKDFALLRPDLTRLRDILHSERASALTRHMCPEHGRA